MGTGETMQSLGHKPGGSGASPSTLGFTEAYGLAQHAIADLKQAVLSVLMRAGGAGLRNADVGRELGIYSGHGDQHEGHISRSILELLKVEGVAQQDPASKLWTARPFAPR